MDIRQGVSTQGIHPRGAPCSESIGRASSKTSSRCIGHPKSVTDENSWLYHLLRRLKAHEDPSRRRQSYTIPLNQVSWPEDYYVLYTRSNSELFSTENKPLNHSTRGWKFSKVLNQKKKEQTFNGNLALFWPVLTEHSNLTFLKQNLSRIWK